MSKTPGNIRALGQVVSLRAREQERLSVALAAQQAESERYRHSLRRLEHLCEQSGASGAQPIALSANCADYKLAVLSLAQTHREALERHEATVAQTRNALQAATRRHEGLDRLLQRRQGTWDAERQTQAQKQQDELASQVWWRVER
jgi:flagellar export protein FliJ